jgi:hypothetical protein
MELLYFLNLFIATSLILSPVWWSRKLLKLDWLNPVTILIICFLPVELFKLFVGQWFREEGLMYPYFQFAVLMTNIQQSIALLLLYYYSHIKITRKIPYLIPRLGFYQKSDFFWISKLFFIMYLFAFMALALQTGGVMDWLLNIRDSYINKRDGYGLYYAAAINFISISYFFFGIASSDYKKFTYRSLLYFIAVYVLGSKGFLLNFFAFYLIIIWRQRKIPVSRILFISLPVIFLLLLANFFSNQETVDFSSVAQYFEYYPNAAMFYADYFSGAIKLFDGQILLSSFWEYVPRGLFPAKPYVYGILHVVEFYFPGGAESGNTPAIYGGVPQFADFGVFGVLVLAMINITPLFYISGLRYALVEKNFLDTVGLSGRSIVIFLVLFSPVFGVFLPVGLVVLLLAFTLCLIQISMIVVHGIKPRRIIYSINK